MGIGLAAFIALKIGLHVKLRIEHGAVEQMFGQSTGHERRAQDPLGPEPAEQDELGVHRVTPALRPEDADMPLSSWMDPNNFNPGYLLRSMDLLPKRGDKPEWSHTQDYWTERDVIPAADLDDGCLVYE